jgi:hypothetical protein
MLEQISNILQFDAFFTSSGAGKTGLSPTVDIYRGATQIVTAGSATEIGGGFYTYQLASGSVTNKNNYRAVFKTTDTTVDQQHIPALWIVGSTWIERIDAAISGIAAAVWDRLTSLITVEDSIGDLIIDNLDAAISSIASGATAAAIWAYVSRTLTSGAAGAGAITFTYTVTSSATSLPIADVDVWVTTDSAGTNVIASGETNASGVVVFYLDAGTYYLWRQKSGYNFTNPDTETVS